MASVATATSRVMTPCSSFIDKIGDRCGEHRVSAGDFPLLLQDDWEGESVLFDFHAVSFGSSLLIMTTSTPGDFPSPVLSATLSRSDEERVGLRACFSQPFAPAPYRNDGSDKISPFRAQVRCSDHNPGY
jgi:hypothetical protein